MAFASVILLLNTTGSRNGCGEYLELNEVTIGQSQYSAVARIWIVKPFI